jgi:hypothetical protein
MRLQWLSAALFLSAALAFFDHIAFVYYIYWRFPWFDTSMHYLGGAAIATLAVGIIHQFRPRMFFALVVFAVVSWEAFEYFAGATTYGKSFILDTSSDFLFDALGIITIYAIARLSLWRSV